MKNSQNGIKISAQIGSIKQLGKFEEKALEWRTLHYQINLTKIRNVFSLFCQQWCPLYFKQCVSSRIRTVPCSGVSRGRGWSAWRCMLGRCLSRRVFLPGGCLVRGRGYLPRGEVVSAQGRGVCQTSVNRITDRCKKHYLAATTLWRVNILSSQYIGNLCLSNGQKPLLQLSSLWPKILDNWQYRIPKGLLWGR